MVKFDVLVRFCLESLCFEKAERSLSLPPIGGLNVANKERISRAIEPDHRTGKHCFADVRQIAQPVPRLTLKIEFEPIAVNYRSVADGFSCLGNFSKLCWGDFGVRFCIAGFDVRYRET